jgi:putative exporter of polyketide antibiotics
VILLLLVAVALIASIAARAEAVQRLDERVLGRKGVAVAVALAAMLLVSATVASVVQHVWPVATVYAGMSCWVSYWAFRRVADLRRPVG